MPPVLAATVSRYRDPRAHALRDRYLATFGGDEIPVPVEAIAEDLLGLRVEQSSEIPYSGMLLPAERKIVLNAAEAPRDEAPLRRFRFTIAHEVGHWVCHCRGRARARSRSTAERRTSRRTPTATSSARRTSSPRSS